MELYDWLVIGIFCLALIGIVVWVVSQKNNNSADYFLGGRDATWIAIGASDRSILSDLQELVPLRVWQWHIGRFKDG